MKNQQWILKNRPSGAVTPADIELIETPIPRIDDGKVLIRNLYLSLDPTNRLWMSDREQYLPPVGLGDVMRGVTIGVVEESRTDRFKPGDIVQPTGGGGWQSHCVLDVRHVVPVPHRKEVPLTAHLSVLGTTGLTAYFGLLDVGRPVSGETIVVSAAAGAVGSIVGQIGRIKECKVVGIAGGERKCSWLTQDLGFDSAINYRSGDVANELDRICPNGVDVNFENVGGPIMDAVFNRLNKDGRMILCGMISRYNMDGPMPGPTDFGRILMQRLTVRGFVVIDYLKHAREALGELSQWIAEGRIKWKDHVVEGLEQAPDALDRLFTGNHDGKLIVRIAHG